MIGTLELSLWIGDTHTHTNPPPKEIHVLQTILSRPQVQESRPTLNSQHEPRSSLFVFVLIFRDLK